MPRQKHPQTVPVAWREIIRKRDRHEIPGPEWLVVLMLAEQMDENGECSPSLLELAEATHQSRSTVKRAVQSLRDKGLLEVTVRKQQWALHQSNVYRAVLPGPSLTDMECRVCGALGSDIEDGPLSRAPGGVVTSECPLHPGQRLYLDGECPRCWEEEQAVAEVERKLGAGPSSDELDHE